jgi:uncharacterized protein (DUF885 family)
MNKILPLLFTMAILFSCASKKEEIIANDSVVQAIMDDYWAFQLEDPFVAAYAGEPNPGSFFPDLSESAIASKETRIDSFLTRLKKLDRNDLTMEDQIVFDLLKLDLENQKNAFQFGEYYLPFNGDESFLSSFSYMIESLPFEKKEDFENYLQRLKAFPAFVRQNISLMEKGIEKGIFQPPYLAANFSKTIPNGAAGKVESHPYFKPFLKYEKGESDQLESEAKLVLEKEVFPVMKELETFLKEKYLILEARPVGVSNLPGGKAYYAEKVRFYTTLDISPDSVFNLGMAEVKRIRKDMEELIKSTGFKGGFKDFIRFLRTDPQFYPKTGDELLAYASRLAKKVDGRLPGYFGKLPRLPYGVEPVPDEIAPYYTAGRYSPGSPKNHKSGTYLVNTYQLESRPFYAFPALTLHEAVPGHHLQISLAQEMPEQHPFRKNTYLSAFGEGWALYCEWLGQEMGIYETPYDEFGRMTYEMWRACRLVVDVGIHTKGFTRQQAFDFLAENTALSLHEVGTEIDRYIGWPAQALSYKMGELTIRNLRQKAEAELGNSFNIREFHDLILSQGSVPLASLQTMVEHWILEKSKQN